MRQDLSKNMFCSPQDIAGYNPLIAFVNAGRGLRKTHNYLLWLCKRYIKHGEEFGYVRRRKTELDDNAFLMFHGLETYNPLEIPKGTFRVVGNNIIFNELAYGGRVNNKLESEEAERDEKLNVKIKDKLREGDHIAGYLFSLSTVGSKKSTPYPRVRTLLFDEYLSETGDYLRNEVSRWVSLSETVFRDRENVRGILLGNTVSVVNPYYKEYRVEPQINNTGEITFYRDSSIVIQNADRPLFQEYKNNRGIQRANKRTSYGRHIIENVSVLDDAENCGIIKRKSFEFNFIADGRDFGFYTFTNKDGYQALYVGEPNYDPQAYWRTCDKRIYQRNSPFIINTSKAMLGAIIERFSIGSLIYFADIEIKQYILPYIL